MSMNLPMETAFSEPSEVHAAVAGLAIGLVAVLEHLLLDRPDLWILAIGVVASLFGVRKMQNIPVVKEWTKTKIAKEIRKEPWYFLGGLVPGLLLQIAALMI